MTNLLSRSWNIFTGSFKSFIPFILIQCAIQYLSPLAEYYGMVPGSASGAWVEILIALLTIWNFIYFLHLLMNLKKGIEEDFVELIFRATYDCPAFFLYSLLYGVSIFLGMLLLVIPGLYFFLFHYFAPLASVLDPEANEGEESYFSYSRRLVKPHWPKVLLFMLILFVLNSAIPTLNYIPAIANYRLWIELFLTPAEVLMVLFGDILAVEIYTFLKNNNNLEIEERL